MKTHELKTWPHFFQALWDKQKTFEMRISDRGFAPGDKVILREYVLDSGSFTGRSIEATIGFILQDGEFGLPSHLCIFSLLDVTNLE